MSFRSNNKKTSPTNQLSTLKKIINNHLLTSNQWEIFRELIGKTHKVTTPCKFIFSNYGQIESKRTKYSNLRRKINGILMIIIARSSLKLWATAT